MSDYYRNKYIVGTWSAGFASFNSATSSSFSQFTATGISGVTSDEFFHVSAIWVTNATDHPYTLDAYIAFGPTFCLDLPIAPRSTVQILKPGQKFEMGSTTILFRIDGSVFPTFNEVSVNVSFVSERND